MTGMVERGLEKRQELQVSKESKDLRQWFEGRRIKMVLFDLDDTLTKTYFKEGRGHYFGELKRISGVSGESNGDLTKKWHEIFRVLKPEFGVNPVTHELNGRYWAKRFGLDFESDEVQAAFKEMGRIVYERMPEDCEGAWSAVQTIKGAGVDVCVVTHGQKEWTDLKMSNWRGEFKQTFCVDVNGPKGVNQWGEVLDELGLLPDEVVVVGDSVESDIEPARALGVAYTVRVANQWDWEGGLPWEVVQVETTGEVPRALLERW